MMPRSADSTPREAACASGIAAIASRASTCASSTEWSLGRWGWIAVSVTLACRCMSATPPAASVGTISASTGCEDEAPMNVSAPRHDRPAVIAAVASAIAVSSAGMTSEVHAWPCTSAGPRTPSSRHAEASAVTMVASEPTTSHPWAGCPDPVRSICDNPRTLAVPARSRVCTCSDVRVPGGSAGDRPLGGVRRDARIPRADCLPCPYQSPCKDW